MKSAVLIVPLLLAAVAPASAQTGTDPGSRDSVWIESVDWNGDQVFATTVNVQSDDSLKQATIVLTWGTTDIQIDSISLAGSRWESVVEFDSGVFVSSDGLVGGVSTGMHRNIAFLPYTRLLSPGSGPVCVIYWSRTGAPVGASTIDVDSATTTSGTMTVNSLLFGFSAQPSGNFVPAFGPGEINVNPCDCPFQSDFNADLFLDATDLAFMIDAVFFGGLDPSDPLCPTSRGDFNCDMFPDASDLAFLIDRVFFGGANPCDPCQ
jgi:hypothetical protein